MSGEEGTSEESGELRKAAIEYTVRNCVGITIMGLIFFLSAGRIDIPRGWYTLGLYFAYAMIQMLIFCKWNPEMLISRLKRRTGPYVWDKIFMGLLGVLMYGSFAVFGFDVGRYQWSSLGVPYFIVGLVIFIPSAVLMTWAMVVNRHFENIVRIQTDRNHQVISTGPYSVIRHPGNLAGFFNFLAFPFIIGSAFGLIPALLLGILMIIRTSLEDKTLQQELDGYSEYTQKVKYKLIPFIW